MNIIRLSISSALAIYYNLLNFFFNVARRCCLWCHITSANLKTPLSVRCQQPGRSLDTLDQDYKKFMTVGKGDIKVIKLYNNVIAPAIVKISIYKVK